MSVRQWITNLIYEDSQVSFLERLNEIRGAVSDIRSLFDEQDEPDTAHIDEIIHGPAGKLFRDIGGEIIKRGGGRVLKRAGKHFIRETIAPAVAKMLFENIGRFGLKSENLAASTDDIASSEANEVWLGSQPSRHIWTPRQNSPVRMQGSCGACWSFAATSALEARINILAGDPDLDITLSPQFVHSIIGTCAKGAVPEHGMRALQQYGTCLEKQFPYAGKDIGTPRIQPYVKIKRGVTLRTVRERKQALIDHGPIIGGIECYQDFFNYDHGVYSPQTQQSVGGHAILIVGYDDGEGCWVCKNSWSEQWGDQGYFKIAYGTCKIDNGFYSYDFDMDLPADLQRRDPKPNIPDRPVAPTFDDDDERPAADDGGWWTIPVTKRFRVQVKPRA